MIIIIYTFITVPKTIILFYNSETRNNFFIITNAINDHDDVFDAF